MKTIVVASTNPVKCKAVLSGFQRLFPQEIWKVHSVAATSEVAHQPMSDFETRQGAINRAHNAQKFQSHADFWVGIEGGVEELNGDMLAFAWITILSKTCMGLSRSGTFLLPKRIADMVREGIELGKADDIFFGRKNSKRENGAIGLLTQDVIDREALYEHAVILALVPFKNPDIDWM